jgi:hypothetical protein
MKLLPFVAETPGALLLLTTTLPDVVMISVSLPFRAGLVGPWVSVVGVLIVVVSAIAACEHWIRSPQREAARTSSFCILAKELFAFLQDLVMKPSLLVVGS